MEVKLYLVSTQDVPTLWGWRTETYPMCRSRLQASTTPHTARPKADSISLLGKERLAHGRLLKTTWISGCKWILGKKWRCRRYKVKDDQTVISGSKAILSPIVMTRLHSQHMAKMWYVKGEERIYHFLLKIVKCVVNIGKQNEYL